MLYSDVMASITVCQSRFHRCFEELLVPAIVSSKVQLHLLEVSKLPLSFHKVHSRQNYTIVF